ncbi:hypothetical protein JOC74_002466 [Bacillus capparidis]|uniref:Uncharacterized protein n=1 Tax=Bacillus capparidis TaxID=1840411 RepID=A0ABS4CXG1_9BACI|nr:hypothetical protein [Bacillus capparidis]
MSFKLISEIILLLTLLGLFASHGRSKVKKIMKMTYIIIPGTLFICL